MVSNFRNQKHNRAAAICFIFAVFLGTAASASAKDKLKNLDSGFYSGALLISFSAGLPLQTGGTLIDAEKEYNGALRARAQSGLAQFALLPVAGVTTVNAGSGSAAPVVNFESNMSGMAEFNLDYGLTDHIGVGMTVSGYTVEGRQQESYPLIDNRGSTLNVDLLGPETIVLTPQTYELFKGFSVLGNVSWHFLSRTKFDPFVTLRAGVTRFSSNAHSNLNYQALRFQERSINATGTTLGAGVGMNIFFRPTVGMRVELSALKHKLKTDRFDRTLQSGHLLFGVILNTDAIQKNEGQL